MSQLQTGGLGGIAQTLNQVTVPAGHNLVIDGDILHHNGNGAFTIPAGTTAQRPGSPNRGDMRFNTSDDALEVWTGTDWKQYGIALGTSSGNPAESAAAILANDASATDGVYWLSHSGGSGAYQAYCDMSNGGYILVGKVSSSPADTSNPWSYSGARWTATSPHSEDGCQSTAAGDSLNRGYYEHTLATGFRFSMNTIGNVLSVARTGVTPRQAFTGAAYNTNKSRSDFLNWIPNNSSEWNNQPHCNRNGFNRTDSSGTAMRYGHTMNNENECNSNDSAIGFGCYTNSQSSRGDRNCACGGFRWGGTQRWAYNGWIWVK